MHSLAIEEFTVPVEVAWSMRSGVGVGILSTTAPEKASTLRLGRIVVDSGVARRLASEFRRMDTAPDLAFGIKIYVIGVSSRVCHVVRHFCLAVLL